MKIGIIGAGNMGGAIARGLINSQYVNAGDITACDKGQATLDQLTADCPGIKTSQDNAEAVKGSDLIILAVKPWLLKIVVDEIAEKVDFSKQTIISIAAGIQLDEIAAWITDKCATPAIVRVIPNTAISVGQSMTFISVNKNVSESVAAKIKQMFDFIGKSAIIEERLMGAATALCSCGIAYAMRYVRAATEGGVELGIYPNEGKQFVLQTLRGAIELLEATGNNPEEEIDKVTTPGGITIKGLNTMEANGFTNAVIQGIKASI